MSIGEQPVELRAPFLCPRNSHIDILARELPSTPRRVLAQFAELDLSVLPFSESGSPRVDRHAERYVKLTQDRDFRLMWADKIGLGFELPGARVGQLGQLLQFRNAV